VIALMSEAGNFPPPVPPADRCIDLQYLRLAGAELAHPSQLGGLRDPLLA
jgi:hypothetical protein